MSGNKSDRKGPTFLSVVRLDWFSRLVYFPASFILLSLGKSRWSPSFLSQASDLSCEPGEIRNNVTFLHGTKSGNFTKLGKVSDLEVCMLLCCELDRCQAAFLAGKNCYSVTCFTTNHCATAPALNNKWQPVVAFVKRLYKAVHVQAGEMSFFFQASRFLCIYEA